MKDKLKRGKGLKKMLNEQLKKPEVTESKTIQVLEVFSDNDSDYPCWNVADVDSGKGFFQYLHNNGLNEGEEIRMVEMTPEEWAECEKRGGEMA